MSVKKTRIMYIELKAGSIEGPARIGRVSYSKSGRSLGYKGKVLFPIKGFKANYIESGIGHEYWVSGPKKRGGDRLYGIGIVEIDDDVREEYWREIREQPARSAETCYRDA